MNRQNDNPNPEREKRVRVRRCRDDFRPTGPTLMQIGCCCCCCCLHWVGAAIGTAVGVTGAFMRESHLEPSHRASNSARRTVGTGLVIGLGGSIAGWTALYFLERLLGSDGEMVAGTLVFAPGFAVLPMSLIVIIFGFLADQTNDQWAPSDPQLTGKLESDKLSAAETPFNVGEANVDKLGSPELDPNALVAVKNWGGLRLAIRAAWMIFAVSTLFSGLGYALMTIMIR